MIGRQKFPKDFLWGASTASHQVEGGTVNQWSRWELEHAADLAAGAEKRLSWLPDWPQIKDQAENPENYVSGKGVDHYNRYEEDFDLLQQLQFNSFRFGIEWSRIQPEEGTFNTEAIQHYHDYIDSLTRRGIEPVLNIWHWTMPTWFTDKGGFEKKENLSFFDTFVRRIAEEYADKVTYVITLNEPNVYTSFSYMTGEWPPQQQSFWMAKRVYSNLIRAHKRAYTILKARRSTLMVGVAAQLGNIMPKWAHGPLDMGATQIMRYGWNWWFLNRIRRHQDFVGINYYFSDYYKGVDFGYRPKASGTVKSPFIVRRNPPIPVNNLGWYMEPEGLYPLIMRTWAHYKKPIIITENGVADEQDEYRQWWLEQTVLAMQKALAEGVDLRGYLHWSLLDNFEWAYGWWPKFGLIAVDREHAMQRSPRPSALWFAGLLRELQSEVSSGKPPVRQSVSSPVKRPVRSTSIVTGVGQTVDHGRQAVSGHATGQANQKTVHPLMAISNAVDGPNETLPSIVHATHGTKVRRMTGAASSTAGDHARKQAAKVRQALTIGSRLRSPKKGAPGSPKRFRKVQ
jgi:beta-glucosidase